MAILLFNTSTKSTAYFQIGQYWDHFLGFRAGTFLDFWPWSKECYFKKSTLMSIYDLSQILTAFFSDFVN